ncbi:DUF433 domain-containing protein [candidate division KSB1 bacterium]|nr:DUF433 domain-containing protein [candidate division KSB1 bacterium]
MKKTKHPFIKNNSSKRGKFPTIADSGIRVLDIAIEYQYKGYTIDQIIDYHPHLKLEHIHDALSFYYENQEQIDRQIREQLLYVEQIKKELSKGKSKKVAEHA